MDHFLTGFVDEMTKTARPRATGMRAMIPAAALMAVLSKNRKIRTVAPEDQRAWAAFKSRLGKQASFGPQTVGPSPHPGGAVGAALKKFQGTGLKAPAMTTSPVRRVPDAPSPSTTPAQMIDTASKM